jgi:hypothetical protein
MWREIARWIERDSLEAGRSADKFFGQLTTLRNNSINRTPIPRRFSRAGDTGWTPRRGEIFGRSSRWLNCRRDQLRRAAEVTEVQAEISRHVLP